MNTFQLLVYNFIDDFHSKLRLKYRHKVKLSHLMDVNSTYMDSCYFYVSARGSIKSFSDVNDAISYCNSNWSAEEIVVFIHKERTSFDCAAIAQPSVKTLTIIINRVIQFPMTVTILPLSHDTLMSLLKEAIMMNSMGHYWQRLKVDWHVYPSSTRSLESVLDHFNDELKTFGEAKLFLKSIRTEEDSDAMTDSAFQGSLKESAVSTHDSLQGSEISTQDSLQDSVTSSQDSLQESEASTHDSLQESVTSAQDSLQDSVASTWDSLNESEMSYQDSSQDSVTSSQESLNESEISTHDSLQDSVTSTQETLNKIVEGIERLEFHIGKNFRNGVFNNIPIQDEELLDFCNEIKTEEQLAGLKQSYEKYQKWLKVHGIKKKSPIIARNNESYDPTNNFKKSHIFLLSLKIYYCDRLVYYKFTNHDTDAVPSESHFEFSYTVPGALHSRNNSFSIYLGNGIDAMTSQAFVTTKREPGDDFRIEYIDQVKIFHNDGVNQTVLFKGKGNVYAERQENEPVRIFNFETIVSRAEGDPFTPNDFVSTDIDSVNSSTFDLDEYDVLTEAESLGS